MTFNSAVDTGLRRLSENALIQTFRHPSTWRSWTQRPWFLFLAVVLIGLALSATVFVAARHADDARVVAVLESRTDWRAGDFESKLAGSQTALAGLAAFIASQKEISAAEFRAFARSIHYSDPSSAALSWDPVVKSSGRAAFVAQARQLVGSDFDIVEKAPDGSIVSAAPRDEYLPLLFYESFDNSAGAKGLDVWSLPGRQAWLSRARDEGRPITTPPIQIFANSKMTLGSVMFWPIYATEGVPATVENRRRDFRGMAVSRTDFVTLLSDAIVNTPQIVGAIELLIDHRPVAVYEPATASFVIGDTPAAQSHADLTFTREFDLFDRHWTLISHFSPEIVSGLRSFGPPVEFLLGMMLTALLAIYAVQVRQGRLGIEEVVRTRTSELTGANRELSENTVALDKSEGRFRRIFDDIPIGLALKSADKQHFIQVNDAFCRMLGYSEQELMQRPPNEFIVPEDRGMIVAAAAGSRPEWHPRDKHYTNKMGETVCALVQNLELGTLLSGEEDVVLSIANDVTEQRKTEAELQQAQKMEAIGNLTGGMAHDFNNLLGIVIGNLDLLRDLRKNDAEADELARDALDASLRGADLTKRLLAFARRQALQPKEVAVNQLISEITKLLARTLGGQIEISLKLAENVWPVFVDPAQLDASLTNLATNARDAMPRGGKLVIATRNQTLDADFALSHTEVTPGDYVLIEVSDTGTGMPQAVTDRIFEPFYTTKEQGKGTGLGLSMVFGFIKQSGGHINVYSELNVGTTFGLYLPRMSEEAARTYEQSSAVSLPLSSGGETVLAVEDDIVLRRVVARQLTELGYQVLEAKDASTAIDVLEQNKVDLLFTDIVMPGGTDGVELASQVHQRWPQIHVLLTSGFPETSLDASNRSLASGTRLLTKPYRKLELATAVRAALDG